MTSCVNLCAERHGPMLQSDFASLAVPAADERLHELSDLPKLQASVPSGYSDTDPTVIPPVSLFNLK